MSKIKTIAPIITQLKRTDVRSFDGLNNLNKRIASQIDSAVRARITESIFLGYFVDGGYAGVLGNELKFRSPVDNYQYKQKQVRYVWSLFATRTADATNPDGSSFVNGQDKIPATAPANSGPGTLLNMWMYVDQNDGAVNCFVAYFEAGGAGETDTNDGILAVTAICNRAL